jgi:hypothetical protein
MIRCVSPVVEFVESSAAMLPPDTGTGYIDHETGRILPGHLTQLVFVVLLGFFYAIGWFALRPPTSIQLPPLAYFLFDVLVAGLATSGAAFFLDRYRVPLLTTILAWFVVATIVGGTDHEFDHSAAALDFIATCAEISPDRTCCCRSMRHSTVSLDDAGADLPCRDVGASIFAEPAARQRGFCGGRWSAALLEQVHCRGGADRRSPNSGWRFRDLSQRRYLVGSDVS